MFFTLRLLNKPLDAAGAPPLGYSWEKNLVKPMIVPNRDAPLVKEAFRMYATGLYTIEFVRKAMNAKGLEIGKQHLT